MPVMNKSLLKTGTIQEVVALLALAAGVFVAAGRVFQLDVLTQSRPGWPDTNIYTAVALLPAGISLFLLTRRMNKSAALSALFVLIPGTAMLVAYLFHWDTIIDDVFWKDADQNTRIFSGRLFPFTAAALVLLALSLLAVSVNQRKYARPFAAWASFFIFSFSLLVLLNYLFAGYVQLNLLPGLSGVSIPEAVSILFLSSGIFLLNSPPGFLSRVTRSGLANRSNSKREGKEYSNAAAAELLYRVVFETSKDGILMIDAETGRVRDANHSFLQLTGWPRAELQGKLLGETGLFKTNTENLITARELQEQEFAHYEDVSLLSSDGSLIRVEFWSTVYEVRGERIRQFTFRDITQRKNAEEELHKIVTRLNEAQLIAHIGSWELDLRSNNLSWSDEIFRIFEIDPARFAASYESFLHTIHPEDRERVNKAYRDSVKFKTNYDLEHRLQLADGRIKFVHERCQTFYDETGNPLRSVGTVQDITEKVMAEKKIREQTEMFAALVDTAPDATIIVDQQGVIALCNLQAVQLLGYEKNELKGMPVECLLPLPQQELHRRYRRSYMKGAYTRQMGNGKDLSIVRKDGYEIPVEISLAPFNSPEGILITASVRDITERKKARQALEDSYDAIRRLSEHLQNVIEMERKKMAREIHDELGQQLTVLKMDTSWLISKSGFTHQAAKERLESLKQMIDTMVVTVRRLLMNSGPLYWMIWDLEQLLKGSLMLSKKNWGFRPNLTNRLMKLSCRKLSSPVCSELYRNR